MFRTQQDIKDTFFPTLDINKETWSVIYDKFEVSNYGRLRFINGKIISPKDNGTYTIVHKFNPIVIKISEYIDIPVDKVEDYISIEQSKEETKPVDKKVSKSGRKKKKSNKDK